MTVMEFGDLDVVCKDGTVRASAFVMSRVSGAEIFVESLRLDRSKIIVPFSTDTMRTVVQFTHDCVGLDAKHLPIGDPVRLARVAEALDFMGSRAAFEFVLERISDVMWRVRDEEVGWYVDSLLFKHGDDDFLKDVVRYAARRFPLWIEFNDYILKDATIDARAICAYVGGAWKFFSPAWIFSAFSDRMEKGSLDSASALRVLSSGFHNGVHPEETAYVLDSVVACLRKEDEALASALVSIRNGCSPEFFVPMRSLAGGTCGSVVTYDFDKKFSIVADLSKASGGARRSYGNYQMRRIADGVRLCVEHGGRTSVEIEFSKVLPFTPFRVATRFSATRDGRCLGEEWSYSIPEQARREHVVVSGGRDAVKPEGRGDFSDQMRRGGDVFLRIDVFYASQTDDPDGFLTAIEQKFFKIAN